MRLALLFFLHLVVGCATAMSNESKLLSAGKLFAAHDVAILSAPLVAFAESPVEKEKGEFNFCQRQFGKNASIRFEPDKANEIGVADTFNGRGSFPSKKPDVPKPKRFRCIVTPINGYEGQGPARCPRNLKPEVIGKTRWCGSKTFELKSLCSGELKHTWPELESTVCSEK